MAWWCMIIIRSCMMMCDAVWCTVQIQRLEFGLMALEVKVVCSMENCDVSPSTLTGCVDASDSDFVREWGWESESQRWREKKISIQNLTHITHRNTSTHIDTDGISQFTPSRNHKIWEKQGKKCKPENNTIKNQTKPNNRKQQLHN